MSYICTAALSCSTETPLPLCNPCAPRLPLGMDKTGPLVLLLLLASPYFFAPPSQNLVIRMPNTKPTISAITADMTVEKARVCSE